MGDHRPRIPIVGEPEPGGSARGPLGIAGSTSKEAALAEFKRTVRERQIEYLVSVKKRTFFPDLADSDLEKIEESGRHRMRREAALACRELLMAARAALASARSAGDKVASHTTAIGVQSAYRNFREDTVAWNDTFTKYYNEMVQSQRFDGSELGAAALAYMLEQMKSFKAPPGYSNHSNGMAVDFNTVHGKVTYEAKRSQNKDWKATWLHRWLVSKNPSSVSNAEQFGFKPLATEAWHWDYDPALRQRSETARTSTLAPQP